MKDTCAMRIAPISLLVIMAISAEASGTETAGRALLENHCAGCHSIEASGESPLPQAPPLREIYLRYPIEQLSQGLSEGMGSRHREMPQIQFSADEALAILNYLGSVTGVAPAEPTTGQPEGVDQTDPP